MNRDLPWRVLPRRASIVAGLHHPAAMWRSLHGGSIWRVLFWGYFVIVRGIFEKVVDSRALKGERGPWTTPTHSKNSPGPRDEVPDRFGESRTF